jgi:5-methyltetrahydrofolate--homocysteine methyltransferase
MSIAFTPQQWEALRARYRAWWDGAAPRPMLHLTAPRASDRPPARLPAKGFISHYGLDVDADDIVDMWAASLAGTEFLADAFPFVWINFGPGVLAAFLGCELHSDDNTTWFLPKRATRPRDLHLRLDCENRWFRHVRAIARAAAARWQGAVTIGMTDLGGASDVVASFLTSEGMLTDLYDDPDEIRRLVWETHTLWWQAWHALDEVMRGGNAGYSAWTPLFSEQPYYMLQSDFCYMIGPEMFESFIRPELVASCRQLPHAFYHLDGVGELPHLDSLLAIEELRGIQWVQGDGKGGPLRWLDVYRRVLDGGKLLQITGGPLTEALAAIEQLEREGRPIGRIYYNAWVGDAAQRRAAADFLKRHGAAL